MLEEDLKRVIEIKKRLNGEATNYPHYYDITKDHHLTDLFEDMEFMADLILSIENNTK